MPNTLCQSPAAGSCGLLASSKLAYGLVVSYPIISDLSLHMLNKRMIVVRPRKQLVAAAPFQVRGGVHCLAFSLFSAEDAKEQKTQNIATTIAISNAFLCSSHRADKAKLFCSIFVS